MEESEMKVEMIHSKGGKDMADIVLLPLEASDRNQFILDNQEA